MADTDEDPTEAMVKREVAEAARIIREDYGLKAMREMFRDYFGDPKPKNDEMVVEESDATPPPAKKAPAEKPKKRGLWWGESLEE